MKIPHCAAGNCRVLHCAIYSLLPLGKLLTFSLLVFLTTFICLLYQSIKNIFLLCCSCNVFVHHSFIIYTYICTFYLSEISTLAIHGTFHIEILFLTHKKKKNSAHMSGPLVPLHKKKKTQILNCTFSWSWGCTHMWDYPKLLPPSRKHRHV